MDFSYFSHFPVFLEVSVEELQVTLERTKKVNTKILLPGKQTSCYPFNRKLKILSGLGQVKVPIDIFSSSDILLPYPLQTILRRIAAHPMILRYLFQQNILAELFGQIYGKSVIHMQEINGNFPCTLEQVHFQALGIAII